jgi:hypothetical protein
MEPKASMGHVLDAEKLEILFFHYATVPSGPGPPHYRGLPITFRHTTLGRTPRDD